MQAETVGLGTKWVAASLFAATLGVMVAFPEWGKNMGGVLMVTGFQALLAFSPRLRRWLAREQAKALLSSATAHLSQVDRELQLLDKGRKLDSRDVAELVRLVAWVGVEDSFWELFWRDGTSWVVRSSFVGAGEDVRKAAVRAGIPAVKAERLGIVLRPAAA